jgi:hypothetical protein
VAPAAIFAQPAAIFAQRHAGFRDGRGRIGGEGRILCVHTYPTVSSRPRGRRVLSLVPIGAEMWICIRYKQTNKHTYIHTYIQTFIFLYKMFIRSVKRYCFVRKYAAFPVQLEIVVLQFTGWCVLIVWLFSSINSAASAGF